MDIISVESVSFKTDMINDEKYWIMIKELIESNLTTDNKSYADIIINDIKSRSYLSISTHKNMFNQKFIKNSVIEYNKSRSIKRVNDIKPDYKYFLEGMRVNKRIFKKSENIISESKLNIPKIWDCGRIKWEILIPIKNKRFF
jgi:hypothetical protein